MSGTVAGLELAHKSYGRLPWGDLVAPAVHLAQQGFSVARALPPLRRKSTWNRPKTANTGVLIPGRTPIFIDVEIFGAGVTLEAAGEGALRSLISVNGERGEDEVRSSLHGRRGVYSLRTRATYGPATLSPRHRRWVGLVQSGAFVTLLATYPA